MQLRRALEPLALALAVCAGPAPAWSEPFDSDEPVAGSLLRYFSDSDHVAVRSLMGNYVFPMQSNTEFSLHWNNERVVIPAIDAPIGSQEAVDAITTASRPIAGNAFEDFVKVRNEFQGGLARGGAALEYYLSTESDYLAQQLGAKVARDFNEQLNVSVGTSYAWDAIEPLADDDTQTGQSSRKTLHWNAVATQVLTPNTMLRYGVEYNLVHGLQHNPYRNVYAGGTNVAERHPDTRQRSDAFVRLNQYFENRSSVRFSYRLYADDWGVLSHELGSKLSQYITQGVFTRYEYRYYTQTSADFQRDVYPTTSGVDSFLTGDYRLADLSSHLFGVALNVDLSSLAGDHRLWSRLGMWVNYERYFNSNNYSANIVETGLDFRF